MAITKINEQTKAPALRNKVNEIVDAVNSGGGSSGGGGSISSIQRTVSMAMQGGRLVSGVTEGMLAASDTAKFFNNMHTVLMLGIEFCTVSDIALESGEELTISYYDGNGGFLGTTTRMSYVPSNACYVRFMLGKSSAYTGERVLKVTVLGKPMFQKSSAPSTDLTYRHFAFDTVKTHAAEPDGTIEENAATNSTQKTRTGSYLGDSSRVFDCGWIMFPPNYTPDGEPVPLAVYCHGTTGYPSLNADASGITAASLYAEGVRFLCNNGYAVADCSGLTSADNPNNSGCSLGMPSHRTSIVNMVKYLTANYNICDDGIYIYGKSAGGFITHSLAYMQPIKIKAAGSMNPAICLLLSQKNHTTQKLPCVKNTASQIGTPTITFTGWDETVAGEYFLDNITRWRQIDAFFQGTDLTDDEVRTIIDACYNFKYLNNGNVYTTTNKIGDLANASSSLNDSDEMQKCAEATQLIAKAKRFISCPTLIFSDPADTNVAHDTMLKYTQMAQRCGSPVFLRTLPAASGRHHSTDTGTETESPIKTTYKTKYGGEVEITVAYAELVDWFNRW